MKDTSEKHGTSDLGSGVTGGEPGTSYDQKRLGEPGDPGVPTGDQYPTNERDNVTEGGHGGVGIDDPPGTHPPGEALSSEPEPTKADRNTGSLGDLTEEASISPTAATKNVASTDDPYSDEQAEQQQATKHSAEQSGG
jgi:hypothetical protein